MGYQSIDGTVGIRRIEGITLPAGLVSTLAKGIAIGLIIGICGSKLLTFFTTKVAPHVGTFILDTIFPVPPVAPNRKKD